VWDDDAHSDADRLQAVETFARDLKHGRAEAAA